MNSHRSSKRQKRLKGGVVLTIGVMLALFLFSDVFGFLVSYITTPLREAKVWFLDSDGALPNYLRDRGALTAEIQTLQDELRSQAHIESTIAGLQDENEHLRSLLSATSSARIAAGVLMRPNETPYDTLLIDRGSEAGIVESAIVYGDGDHVIGIVRRVFPHSALVSLVSTPGVVSTVYMYGPDIYTEAVGMGGGVLRVGVPQGIELSIDDVVVLPSVEPGIFGTVTEIAASESSPEQQAFVTGPVPLSSLRFVSVGRVPYEQISFEDAARIVSETRDNLLTVDVPEEIFVATTTATTTEEGIEVTAEE